MISTRGAPAGTVEAEERIGLLAEALRLLPFGLSIQSLRGAAVYSNPAARAHGADRSRAEDCAPIARVGELAPACEPDGAVCVDPVEVRRCQAKLGDRMIEIRRQAIELNGAPYVVATSTDVTERMRLEDELFRRAYFDELTELPNGALLKGAVNDLASQSEPKRFALVFVDVDHFKYINDYYGHAEADALLKKIARRIADQIRPTDMLARIGGDEFALLLTPIGDPHTLRNDVEHLSKRLKEPFYIDGHEVFSSASIGVSLFPIHGRSYEQLRLNAGGAANPARGGAKSSVNFFDPAIAHRAAERAKLEQRMRLAIRDRRLCCAFQPKFDFRSQTVVGLEVLLRWRDEQGLIHAPGDFVNLAVELGLMDEIARLVLGQTVDVMDRVDDAFGRHVTISLNVAAKQAVDLQFMRSYVEALGATGYAERFVIEITEEAFFQKSHFEARVLPMLRELGAKVSIDDFGVGYSSLAALAEISADEVKVDRSFITAIQRRPRCQSVLKAIESMGEALGMSVIVEGVETREEAAYLEAETRIRVAQGFYFAKPMFFDEIPRDVDAIGRIGRSAPRAMAATRTFDRRPSRGYGDRES